MNNSELALAAAKARAEAVSMVYRAQSGHPGGSLSCVDIVTSLYFEEMKVDPKNPHDPDRDRFVMSKGHCSPCLYSVLALRGFFPVEDLKMFRRIDGHMSGHVEMHHVPGVDMSTGSLGQGISVAVGMALAGKIAQKNYRVYAVMGDGEIQEGMIWEAAMLAGHRKLDNLCAVVDNNGLQIDGRIDQVMNPYPITDKLAAFGLHVIEIDGHDFRQMEQACAEAKATKGVPTAIVMKTVKGKDVSYMENQADWHGKAPNDEEYARGMADLAAVRERLEA
jgi:transketolase